MRVLVLRAEEAAGKTAFALAAADHEAVLAPVTRIVGTDAPLPAKRFDAILATSANAFIPPPETPSENSGSKDKGLPVFVVGKATGEAARRQGFRDIRLSQGDASSLVTLLRLTLPGPARLLYRAGQDRKPLVETSLAEAGYTVEIVIAYEAVAMEHWPDDVTDKLQSGQLDAALHFSRRSVELALTLAAGHGVLAPFLALDHYCLSEDVAEPLRRAGATTIRVAPKPDEPSLLLLIPSAR